MPEEGLAMKRVQLEFADAKFRKQTKKCFDVRLVERKRVLVFEIILGSVRPFASGSRLEQVVRSEAE